MGFANASNAKGRVSLLVSKLNSRKMNIATATALGAFGSKNRILVEEPKTVLLVEGCMCSHWFHVGLEWHNF